MRNFVALLNAGLLVCLIGFLSGCGDAEGNLSNDSQLHLGISVSERFSALPPTGTLKAYVTIDGGSRMAMNISGSEASKTLSLAPGSHAFTIEFEFDSATLGTVALASSTKTIDISAENSSVSFSATEYIYDDEDGDSTSNLDELIAGTYSAPSITSTIPADGATNISRGATVSVTFSEEMSATTIDSSSFTLQDASGNSVAGTVNYDAQGNTASFTPSGELALPGSYTATLTSGITDLAGNALSTTTWNFSVGDARWNNAELIETDNAGDASFPQIAMDAGGNALAVWEQSDNTRYNIWINRYVAGSGWGSAELIETENAGDASSPQIVMDANGNALAVWSQHDGTNRNIWANRYIAGSGWGSAERIETDSVGNMIMPQPRIAMDANGNALVVWQQYDGTRVNIQANRYVAGSGWGNAELIETDNAGDAYLPQIAMDTNGNAIAVWQQRDSTRYTIRVNRYVASSGWGTAELIETDNVRDAESPQIAMDTNGNAMAVWQQWGSTSTNIWANRYVTGSGWGTAELIETDNAGSAVLPQIAMDTNGNAMAVWQQWDSTRYTIRANRYVAGSGWDAAELLETDNAGSAVSPQIDMDANGKALAVWSQGGGMIDNIWANRFE